MFLSAMRMIKEYVAHYESSVWQGSTSLSFVKCARSARHTVSATDDNEETGQRLVRFLADMPQNHDWGLDAHKDLPKFIRINPGLRKTAILALNDSEEHKLRAMSVPDIASSTLPYADPPCCAMTIGGFGG